MRDFLKSYGVTLGPLGIPMSDAQAFAIDKDLQALPAEDRILRKAGLSGALLALEPGERADVSWITTEAVDRYQEVVLAKGIDDSHFRLNPLVTLGHAYWMPPVGRCMWLKAHSADGKKGIVAKTHYPARPMDWQEDTWPPDECLQLMQAGLLNAKSIGFIGRREDPTDEERDKYKGAKWMIRQCKLVEYAVAPLGVNPETLVQAVSKSWQPALSELLGLKTEARNSEPEPRNPIPDQVQFVSLSALKERLATELSGIDPKKIAEEALRRFQGRV